MKASVCITCLIAVSVLKATDLYNMPKLIQTSFRNTLLQIMWKSTVIFTP